MKCSKVRNNAAACYQARHVINRTKADSQYAEGSWSAMGLADLMQGQFSRCKSYMIAAFHMMLQPMEDLLNLTCSIPFNSCVYPVKPVAFSHWTTKKVEIQWDRDPRPGCAECIQRQKNS